METHSLIAIGLPLPLLKRMIGSQYIVLMSKGFSKFTLTIQTSLTAEASVATIFRKHCFGNICIPTKDLAQNGLQFMSTFFAAICSLFSVKEIMITEYHTLTNLQVERFNQNIVSRLQNYMAEHQKNWDTFMLHLTSLYIVKICRAGNHPPFSLLFSRKPPKLATICPPSTPRTSRANMLLLKR